MAVPGHPSRARCGTGPVSGALGFALGVVTWQAALCCRFMASFCVEAIGRHRQCMNVAHWAGILPNDWGLLACIATVWSMRCGLLQMLQECW